MLVHTREWMYLRRWLREDYYDRKLVYLPPWVSDPLLIVGSAYLNPNMLSSVFWCKDGGVMSLELPLEEDQRLSVEDCGDVWYPLTRRWK